MSKIASVSSVKIFLAEGFLGMLQLVFEEEGLFFLLPHKKIFLKIFK
jgi:hypothetical protein